MHQLINILLFHFAITPLDRATFPSSYEYYNGAEREYRVEYLWESDRVLTFTSRSDADGKGWKKFLILDNDSRLIADSALDPNGNPVQGGKYEYQSEKLVAYRIASQATLFHYVGGRLDSVAVKKGDSLIEYNTYRYDSQNRLIRSDSFYDNSGLGYLQDFRSMIEYFLPDSIVVSQAFVPVNGDSAKSTIHLRNGFPVKMIEREYFSSSSRVGTHIWFFPSHVSIAQKKDAKLSPFNFAKKGVEKFNILGRRTFIGINGHKGL